MSRDEVAALLGIKPNSVRDTLRRHGITERRGYDRVAVENLQRPGRGYRTDLRRTRMLTITDTIGTSGSITVEPHAVAEAIRPWYPEAPDEVYEVIEQLQDAIDRGRQDTGEWETDLGIQINRA